MTLPSSLRLGVAVALLTTACGGDRPAPGPESSTPAAGAPAPPSAAVMILEPLDGSVVSGDSVHVRLSAKGVVIVPAGDMTPGTGHHHLYLDDDLGQPGQVVPSVPGHVVHLGTGVSEYTFPNVPAGVHRLIAVVADGAHVPLQPWVTDTVRFVVH